MIEAELAFLHDFFFTTIAYIMYGNELGYCARSLALTFFSIFVGAWSLSVLNTQGIGQSFGRNQHKRRPGHQDSVGCTINISVTTDMVILCVRLGKSILGM